MFNKVLFHIFSIFILLSSIANSSRLYSTEIAEVLDGEYLVKIVSYNSFYRPPSKYSDFWRATKIIKFDNGLEGDDTTKWKHESQAKEVASEKTHSGYVNILPLGSFRVDSYTVGDYTFYIYDYFFKVKFEDSPYSSYLRLSINKDHDFSNTPKIVSVVENVETISGWLFNSYKYQYIIELSNDSIWVTKSTYNKNEYSYLNSWKEGSNIVIVGNNEHPCLINIDSLESNQYFLDKKNFSLDLERVH